MELKKRILIVDDDETSVIVLEKFLLNQGFIVQTTKNPIDAIYKIKNGNYDIVITDLKMPQLNGFEILLWIKKNRPEIHVIIATGFSSPNAEEFYNKNGVLKYLKKPIKLEELKETILNSENLGFSGELKEIELFGYLQICTLSKKNKIISISPNNSDKVGLIFIENGQIIHVQYCEFKGEDAFNNIMAIENGNFSERKWIDPPERTINMPTESLMFQATQLIDEGKVKKTGIHIDKNELNKLGSLAIKKILITDFDKINRSEMSKHLVNQELIVATSDNVTNSINLINQDSFDLIITEINLPDYNGLEFLLWIKKHKPDSNVILMSESIDSETRGFANDNGALSILEKPIDYSKLDNIVNIKDNKKGFQAHITDISLLDFIQLVILSQKDRIIGVQSKINQKIGYIYFEKGKIFHAVFDDIIGEEAFLRISTIKNGVFSDFDLIDKPNKTINKNTNMLLMSATRRMDEVANIQINDNLINTIEDKINKVGEVKKTAIHESKVKPKSDLGFKFSINESKTSIKNFNTKILNKGFFNNSSKEKENLVDLFSPDTILSYIVPNLNDKANKALKDNSTPGIIFKQLKQIDNYSSLNQLKEKHYKSLSIDEFFDKHYKLRVYFDYSKTNNLPENSNLKLQIGSSLVFLQFINKDDLEEVITNLGPESNQKLLGEILVKKKLIDFYQLNQALIFQDQYNSILDLVNN